MKRTVITIIQEAEAVDLAEIQAVQSLAYTKAEALTTDGSTQGSISLKHGSCSINVSLGTSASATSV